jgi:hypothetical protein
LHDICRSDLEITRQRTVERAWQFGAVLGIPNLDQLLPPRLPQSEGIPAIATPGALAHAEAAAGALRDAESLKAGWLIYIATATRIATQELPSGVGLLGEAIASLYALFGEVRTALKAIPPARLVGAHDSIEGLAFSLLNEGLAAISRRMASPLRGVQGVGTSRTNGTRQMPVAQPWPRPGSATYQ